jgi:hypothetical protein
MKTRKIPRLIRRAHAILGHSYLTEFKDKLQEFREPVLTSN